MHMHIDGRVLPLDMVLSASRKFSTMSPRTIKACDGHCKIKVSGDQVSFGADNVPFWFFFTVVQSKLHNDEIYINAKLDVLDDEINASTVHGLLGQTLSDKHSTQKHNAVWQRTAEEKEMNGMYELEKVDFDFLDSDFLGKMIDRLHDDRSLVSVFVIQSVSCVAV